MTNLKSLLIILTVLVLLIFAGCNTTLESDTDISQNDISTLDFSSLPHAVLSGKPLSYLALESGQTPKAVQCQPVWDRNNNGVPYYQSKGPIQVSENSILNKVVCTNEFGQSFSLYTNTDETTGETYYEYYYSGRLIVRDIPQLGRETFRAEWVGENRILFHNSSFEATEEAFYVFDAAAWSIYLISDGKLIQMPVKQGITTDDMWNVLEPSSNVRLAGCDGKTGQLLVYVEQENTTLLEYNILRPGYAVVLIENLPRQNNCAIRTDLWEHQDGTVWFSSCVSTTPDQSGMVYQYNSRTNVLTPVLTYDYNDTACYFQREAILIHCRDTSDIGILYYNTDTVFKLRSTSGIYAVKHFGPEENECLLTYETNEKIHSMWNLSTNKRYYLTYDDMIRNFPEGDEMVYFHGAGTFHVNTLSEGCTIDWYASMHKPLLSTDSDE